MSQERADAQERTESPTPRRREEARREGQVARSQELSGAVVLLSGTVALAAVGGSGLAAYTADLLRVSTAQLAGGPLTQAGAVALLQDAGGGLLRALLPVTGAIALLVAGVNLAQARGVWSWKPLTPKWSHLNPVAGFKRLFAAEAAFTLLKSVLKISALGFITYWALASSWNEILSLAGVGATGVAVVLRALLIKMAVVAGGAFLVVAGLDYAFQLHRMEKRLRMTRQEVVREYRETEGDPLIKSRIQSIARTLARKRMLQDVPRADVVIVNPTEIAVALKYDTALAAAPVVVAMGERKLAQRIRALATAAGVTVIENRPVARALLATGKVGRPIPPALYAAVAEILAFVYRRRGLALDGGTRSAAS